MDQSYFVGVDISKSKVDYVVVNSKLEYLLHREITNKDVKLRTALKQLAKQLEIRFEEMMVCCEDTGIYNRPLERVCSELGVLLWVEHPVKIKRASSELRGKNDKLDAWRIAEYSVRYHDRAIAHQEASELIMKLRQEHKVRESLLAQKVALKNQLKEAKSHDPEAYKLLHNGYRKVLKTLIQSIEESDKRLKELIEADSQVQKNVELMTSINGIGIQTAIQFVIYTENFRSFTSAKHLACYAGVVPFSNESGTVVKKPRISKMANMVLKKLLHTAAMSAIRFNKELRVYYLRKVAEGKTR